MLTKRPTFYTNQACLLHIKQHSNIQKNGARCTANWHYDGSSFILKLGVVKKKGSHCQAWQLWMTNHHIIPADSRHAEVVRRNCGPLLLLEALMMRTAWRDLAEPLKLFMNMQMSGLYLLELIVVVRLRKQFFML